MSDPDKTVLENVEGNSNGRRISETLQRRTTDPFELSPQAGPSHLDEGGADNRREDEYGVGDLHTSQRRSTLPPISSFRRGSSNLLISPFGGQSSKTGSETPSTAPHCKSSRSSSSSDSNTSPFKISSPPTATWPFGSALDSLNRMQSPFLLTNNQYSPGTRPRQTSSSVPFPPSPIPPPFCSPPPSLSSVINQPGSPGSANAWRPKTQRSPRSHHDAVRSLLNLSPSPISATPRSSQIPNLVYLPESRHAIPFDAYQFIAYQNATTDASIEDITLKIGRLLQINPNRALENVVREIVQVSGDEARELRQDHSHLQGQVQVKEDWTAILNQVSRGEGNIFVEDAKRGREQQRDETSWENVARDGFGYRGEHGVGREPNQEGRVNIGLYDACEADNNSTETDGYGPPKEAITLTLANSAHNHLKRRDRKCCIWCRRASARSHLRSIKGSRQNLGELYCESCGRIDNTLQALSRLDCSIYSDDWARRKIKRRRISEGAFRRPDRRNKKTSPKGPLSRRNGKRESTRRKGSVSQNAQWPDDLPSEGDSTPEDLEFYTPVEHQDVTDADIETIIRQFKYLTPDSFPGTSPIDQPSEYALALPQKLPVCDPKLSELQKALRYAKAHVLIPDKDRNHWVTEVERLNGEVGAWEAKYYGGNKLWKTLRDRDSNDGSVRPTSSKPSRSRSTRLKGQNGLRPDVIRHAGALINAYEHHGGWNEHGCITLDIMSMYDRVERSELSSQRFISSVAILLRRWLRMTRGDDAVRSFTAFLQQYRGASGALDQSVDDFQKPIWTVEDESLLAKLELDTAEMFNVEKDHGKDVADRLRRDNDEIVSVARKLGLSVAQLDQFRYHVLKQFLLNVQHGNRIATSRRDDVKPKTPSPALQPRKENQIAQQKWQSKWMQPGSTRFEQWERDIEASARDRAENYAMLNEQMEEEQSVKQILDAMQRKRENDRQQARERFDEELRRARESHEYRDRQETSNLGDQRRQEDAYRHQRRIEEDVDIREKVHKAEAAIAERFRRRQRQYAALVQELRKTWIERFCAPGGPDWRGHRESLQQRTDDLEARLSDIAEDECSHRAELIAAVHAHLSQRPIEDERIRQQRDNEDELRRVRKSAKDGQLRRRQRDFEDNERRRIDEDQNYLAQQEQRLKVALESGRQERETTGIETFRPQDY